LTEVRGIGPWTVHMLLLFYLGRPDVLPTGDFAIRAAFKKLYRKRKDPTPEALIRHARRWQPYRSVASWYLWRSLDTNLISDAPLK
jgi:3-methyladenine DNA glycosylase/8-oxoguanine DNA glycosylase